jgi:hypothetical protein
MILHSELSRRRIRSIKKLIRVNKLEVVSVLRVDKDKGAWVWRSISHPACRPPHSVHPPIRHSPPIN